VAGNLSENYIYRYAAEFESSLRLGRPDVEKYAQLKSACDEFKVRVSSNISEKDAALSTGTLGEFWRNITALKEALNEYDLNKCTKAAEVLKDKNWPITDKNSQLLEQLCGLVEKYDYEKALAAIEEMTQ
jgi:hypothetical protein